ncbi:MAG: glutamate synthase, partial [Deltaproteobacteria bacterium]|nr:glutamate synthase [Deltaproteobacteria bacterium]
MSDKMIKNIIKSRSELIYKLPAGHVFQTEAEGGCGVTGFACSIPVRGKHIFEPSKQMHNRGNGRGGGIAAMGFDHNMLGVSPEILREDYILQIAVLEEGVIRDLESKYITPFFNVDFSEKIPRIDDYRNVPGLLVQPPDVWRFFVRVKPEVLNGFISKNHLEALSSRQAEDEFVYQNST